MVMRSVIVMGEIRETRGRLQTHWSAVGRHRRRFALGAVAAMVGIGFVRAAVSAATFSYKAANNMPVEHPINVRLRQMAEEIKRETNGRLDISNYPNSVLGGETAMMSQLRLGALEFFVNVGALAPVVPVANIQGVPFAFKSYREVFAAQDGDLGAYVRKECAAKGIFAFAKTWDVGFRQITNSKKPIKTPDDMVGLKMRVPVIPIYLATFKALGAAPTPMELAQTYTSLQTHLIDGSENSYALIDQFHWYEVQKYLSITNHIWAGDWLIANGEKWNALPADIQAVVEKSAAKYALLQRRDSELLNASVADKLKREGMLFNTTDREAFRSRLGPAYQEWKKEFGGTVWEALEKYTGKLA
jgi:TRAP-type transport system periplasmic protein